MFNNIFTACFMFKRNKIHCLLEPEMEPEVECNLVSEIVRANAEMGNKLNETEVNDFRKFAAGEMSYSTMRSLYG
jgi:hypothetical protein